MSLNCKKGRKGKERKGKERKGREGRKEASNIGCVKVSSFN
jgi:hypothetical protein